MKRIAIASPYAPDSLTGNAVTARRLAGILCELGYVAAVQQGWEEGEEEILLALHAVKGAEAVRRFREQRPDGKVIVLFTGTDLYRDLPAGLEEGRRTLAKADRLVVMTEAARDRIPVEFQEKVRVVPKSVVMPLVEVEGEDAVFGVSVIGHMRVVKNPFQLVEVVACRPEWEQMRVWQVGRALEEEMASMARSWQERESRYRWLGEVPREEGLRWMKRSALTVNTSWMEGASNVLFEAMALEVPVLASDAEGNVGVLGTDHRGLFEAGNDEALTALLRRAWEEEGFLGSLRKQGQERFKQFSRAAEMKKWEELLQELDRAG